jgi:hypothetical protein
VYFVELAIVCIALKLAASYLERTSDNRLVQADDFSGTSSADLKLEPVEIAYLGRDGDSTFALIVLVFDMLHKELKTRFGGATTQSDLSGLISQAMTKPGEQTHYEERLKVIIKGSLKNWGEKTVDAAGLNIKKNPVAALRRLPWLYKLLSGALKDTAHEILKDPRQLRRYISKAGLMRIFAEIAASGYKQMFDKELRQELLRKGLLLTENSRKKLAGSYLACFVVAQLAYLALILYAVPDKTIAAIIFITATLSGFAVKAAIGARAFIPLYYDLSEVLRLAPRSNFRIKALRLFLGIVNFVLNGLSIFVFLALLAIGSAILYLTHTVTSATYLMLLAMMAAQFVASHFLFESYRLNLNESAAPHALRHIKLLKERYRDTSSIDALKSLLTSSQYDSEPSYLLAIFGIETLLFL